MLTYSLQEFCTVCAVIAQPCHIRPIPPSMPSFSTLPSSPTAAPHVPTTRCPVPIIHLCSRSPSCMRILKACAQALWQQPHMRQQPCCFVPIIHQCSESPHSMQSFPACTKLSDCSNTLADNRAALSPSSLVSQKPSSMLSFTARFQALQQQQRHAALFPLTACA